jgi:hypothetical protein
VKKKILLLTLGLVMMVSGCGKNNEVENWQTADKFGEVNENIEIVPLYEWGVQSDDLLIDKYINLKEENTYKTMTIGIFQATWNLYADDNYKINKFKTTEGINCVIYKAQVGHPQYSIYMNITEIDNEINKIEITFSNNIPFDESCKYTTLLYYILCPFESKTKINESIEEIYSGDNTRVGNASDVKTLIITSNMQKDGRFIRLTYTRK